jgi:uncharacterized protein RhaS with RHS repeats
LGAELTHHLGYEKGDPGGRGTVQGAGAETFQYDAIGRLSVHTDDLGTFNLGYLGQTGQITSRPLSPPPGATSPTPTTAGSRVSPTPASPPASSPTSPTPRRPRTSSPALPRAATPRPLTFDANGNLTSDGQRTYAWDAENRLVGIGYPGVSGKATAFIRFPIPGIP